MVYQHEPLVDAAPNCVELVAAHLDDGVRHLAGQLQVLAVVLTGHTGVECFVGDGDKALAASLIDKDPVGKLSPDFLGLEVGQVGLVAQHHSVPVRILVGDGDALAVQRAVDDVKHIGALRAPLIELVGVVCLGVSGEGVGQRGVADLGGAANQVLNERGVDISGHPA